jgi:hypothetical protein
MKLKVAFRCFANAPKNKSVEDQSPRQNRKEDRKIKISEDQSYKFKAKIIIHN